MDILEKSLDFEVIYQKDRGWGQLDSNGSWTGLIGSVSNQNPKVTLLALT